MLQQVKVANVARQYRTSIFSSGSEEQCVVQDTPPLFYSVSLGPGQRAGQHSGFPPDLGIGRDRPVAGPPVYDRGNLLDDLGRLGVSGIEQAAGRRQLGFRDRAMPCLGRPQHRFAPLRKTALKNINVDRCIVEQLGGSMAGRSNELKLRFGPRSELRSMFVGFEPPENSPSNGALCLNCLSHPRGQAQRQLIGENESSAYSR